MKLNIEVAIEKINKLLLKDKSDNTKALKPLDFKNYFEAIDPTSFNLPVHNILMLGLKDNVEFHGKRNINVPKVDGHYIKDNVNGRYLTVEEYLDDTDNILPTGGQYIGFCDTYRIVFFDDFNGGGITNSNKADVIKKANDSINEQTEFDKRMEATITHFVT